MPKPGFYAVARGRNVGVFNTWDECKAQVDGFPNARFKKFGSYAEASDFAGSSSNIPVVSYGAGGRVSKPWKNKNQPAFGTRGKSYGSYSKTASTSWKKSSYSAPANDENDDDDDDTEYLVAYTDGACTANGTRGAKGGVGVYFGDDHAWNYSGPLYGRQTNNNAEIRAAIKAAEICKATGNHKLEIRTDSQFMMKCMQEWMPRWKKNGWKTAEGHAVKNKEELVELERVTKGLSVRYVHVRGHSGDKGNDAADELARAGAAM